MQTAWNIAVVLCAILFVCFVFVIAFGAPYLPTLKPQVQRALNMANLKPGDTLLELGSGDGRILIEAAKRGINSVGYELNPLLVIYSWIITLRYRGKIKIVWGNFWHKKLPPAEGIFVFLLQPYMEKLDTKITQESKKPVKLVSFAFHIPNKKPLKEEKGMYLYSYK